MDFSSMMNAASKNAKKASREVDRIQEEVNNEKNESRRQLEAEKRARIEIQRRKLEKEKEMAQKRKEREEDERRKNFTIPKRNEGPSSSSSTVNTAAVRAVLERQRAEKEAKEKKAESDKQKLMVLRMQANGGKATKKMGKQFGLDVIDLQTRFGGNNEHLEVLQKRKYKEEEEADMEADRYRSGVYKALAAKQKNESSLRATVQGPHRVSTSKSNSLAGLCSRHERTRDTFSPPKDGKKGPDRREPVVEKKKIQAAAPIDFKSLMAAASSISEGKSVNLDHLQAKPAKSLVTQQKNGQQKSGLASSDRDKLREKERIKEKQERQREAEKLKMKEKERERARAAAAAAHKSSSIKTSSQQNSGTSSSNGHSAPPKKEVRKPFTKGPTSPPLIPAAVPGKKYLPGDVRYKEQQQLMKAIAAAPGSSRNGPSSSSSNGFNNKDRIQAVREAERQREKDREKNKAMKRAREEQEMKEYERNKKIQRKTEKSGPSSSASYSSSSSSSKNPEFKRSYEARRMAELREQQMREKERKKKKMMSKERDDSRGSGSFYRGGDDYSDDDEVDEDEYDDEDDYSDMDDFIDDTDIGMDGMNRKDFEETLRMVNRKYDTDKWSRREKMISERDMHSDFRRIQTEENYSKRAGFMEDLQEASKGRSVKL